MVTVNFARLDVLDLEIKDLEDVESILEKHDERIDKLESNQARMEEKLDGIGQQLTENRNINLQANNMILQTLQNVVTEQTKVSSLLITAQVQNQENKTEIEIKKSDNKTNLLLKIFGVITAVATAFFAGKQS